MKLSDHCYAVLGLGCYPPWVVNAGFIAGAERTLVVDSSAGYLSAQTIFGYAQGVNPSNDMILVNTEKHLDHIGGNCLFAEKGVEIYAHELNRRHEDDLAGDRDFYNSSIQEQVRREAREEQVFYQRTTIVNAAHVVENNEIFDLGGLDAKIIFTPGHTDTNLSVYVPSEKILYCGDVITQGYIPNLENSGRDGWRHWLDSLDRISTLDLNAIVPGHGNVLVDDGIRSGIQRIREFLLIAIDTGRAPTAVS
jgi:glyoxylase-like metal-dependent hydrolase (beta-lactamase superfamily II)